MPIPYDENYGSCERTCVTLCIYSGEDSPDQVTGALALEPTDVSVRGRRVTNSLGRTRVEPKNAWFLKSEGVVASRDLRHHLDWLFRALGPRRGELVRLLEAPGYEACVYCVWWSATGHGGPTLGPEQMRKAADLNLELWFDIYFFGEKEGQITQLTRELEAIRLDGSGGREA